MTTLSGVWLPIVTPFHDGAVDFVSYDKLIDHYIAAGISGIFPLGTTGESPTLDDDECEALVERTLGVVAGRVPVFVGIGSNSTAKTLKTLRRLDRHDFAGIVSVCPYYNRPPQDGMREHFRQIAAATDRQIVIYNIPYRTGVNPACRRAWRPNWTGRSATAEALYAHQLCRAPSQRRASPSATRVSPKERPPRSIVRSLRP